MKWKRDGAGFYQSADGMWSIVRDNELSLWIVRKWYGRVLCALPTLFDCKVWCEARSDA